MTDNVNKPAHYTAGQGTKFCGMCQMWKHPELFAKNRVKKDGLQERCRACRAYHYERSKYLKRARVLRRKSIYGISEEEYRAMYEACGGRCSICRGDRKLVIDHCHDSGRVRGLLCDNCNRGIGLIGDSPEILARSAEYLR